MIIHFTKDIESLISILKEKGLRLKYCEEEFSNVRGKISSHAAHPMVSFSEYDENILKGKDITYGNCGIAFNDKWVSKKEIHPVNYLNNKSFAASGLETLLTARRKNTSKLPSELRLAIMKIKCFTKNRIGHNSHFKNKNKGENFRFYEENEWRFVPTKKQIGGGYISIQASTHKREKEKEKEDKNYEHKYNRKIKNYPLKFELSDIKYIYADSKSINFLIKLYPELKEKIKPSCWKS